MNQDQILNAKTALNFLKSTSSEHSHLIFNVLSSTQNILEYSANLKELKKNFDSFDISMSKLLVTKNFFLSHLQQKNFQTCSDSDYKDFFSFLNDFPNDSLENLTRKYRFMQESVENMPTLKLTSLLFEIKEIEKDIQIFNEKSANFEESYNEKRSQNNQIMVENQQKAFKLQHLEAEKKKKTKELQQICDELQKINLNLETKSENEEEKKSDEPAVNSSNPFFFERIDLENKHNETERQLQVKKKELEAKISCSKKNDEKKHLVALLEACKRDMINEKDKFESRWKRLSADIADYEEMEQMNNAIFANFQQEKASIDASQKKKEVDENKFLVKQLDEQKKLKERELQNIEKEISLNSHTIILQQEVGPAEENPYKQKIQLLTKRLNDLKQEKDKMLKNIGFMHEDVYLSTWKLMKNLEIPLQSRIENVKIAMSFFNELKVYLDEAKFLLEAGMENEGLKFMILFDF